MEKLSYQTLKDQDYQGYMLEEAPEKVLQFGEGNFMRAFVDAFINDMNEKADFNGKVVMVQPTGRSKHRIDKLINEQDGLYTLYLQGFQDRQQIREKKIISAASRVLNPIEQWEEVLEAAKNPDIRFITSNTTEAGIAYDPACRLEDAPAASFPAKMAQVLYRRYQAGLPGTIVLACELIEDNGKVLKDIILKHAADWNLPEDFARWINEENIFCSTLVDRIVTGFPKTEEAALTEENGYIDNAMDSGEIFGVWVIEGPQSIKDELPFEKAGLPILVTDNHKPYKERKVRILNGAHTSMVLGAFLAGQDIVRDCMYDPVISGYLNQAIFNEIIPTLSLPEEDCIEFAKAVESRFKNPYIDHELLAISLNSVAKWKARVLPSLLAYVKKFDKLPPALTASLASLIAFYRSDEKTEEGLKGLRKVKGDHYPIKDDQAVLDFFAAHAKDSNAALVQAVLSNTEFWGQDLCKVPGLEAAVLKDLDVIDSQGAEKLMESVF